MDEFELLTDRQRRRRRALERLGFKNAKCRCGHNNPLSLQLDHLAGKKNGHWLAVICSNCHIERTDRQLNEHPRVTGNPRNPLSKIANLLFGACDHLELLARHLREAGEELLSLIPFLNF
jgi:hypothetical protein